MSAPVRIAVLGAAGRLGRRVVAHALADPQVALVAALGRGEALGADVGVLASGEPCGVPITSVGPGCLGDADVLIDVSLGGGLEAVSPFLGGAGVVTGVTGADDAVLLDALAAARPVLRAANFAAGVVVLSDLVARAARALPEADIEVVEAHHRHKRDAPSGTALVLAQAAAAARGLGPDAVVVGRSGPQAPRGPEIVVHALRGGDVVGEHTVWLCTAGERLQLGHVATSRDTFAAGAVRAARFLGGRSPGRYTMADALGLSTSF